VYVQSISYFVITAVVHSEPKILTESMSANHRKFTDQLDRLVRKI